jgi:hypothetical protein
MLLSLNNLANQFPQESPSFHTTEGLSCAQGFAHCTSSAYTWELAVTMQLFPLLLLSFEIHFRSYFYAPKRKKNLEKPTFS